MRIHVLLSCMLLTAFPVSGADYNYTVERGEWLFIPVPMPQAVTGGGDFYNLQVDLVVDGDRVEYALADGGVKVRSASSGSFKMLLHVNHIGKTSCAGVKFDRYSSDIIQVQVSER